MFSGYLGNGSQAQSDNKVVAFVVKILLYLIGDHHQDIIGLIHELRKAQIANSLLGKIRRCHQLNAFYLTKMGGVAQQIKEEKLRYVPVTIVAVFLLLYIVIFGLVLKY